MTDNSGGKLNDRLNIIFIDLVTIRKLSKKKSEKKFSPVEKWGLFFSYVDHENKKDLIKNIADSDEGIMAAERIVKEMSKADNNWYIQNSRWVAKRDEQARKSAAREKGLAEGRTQGLAEGRAQGLAQGLAEGREKGLAEGREKGLAEGREKGLAEGREKGLAEGAQQKAMDAAINLLKMKKLSPEEIAQAQELPLEKVLELQKSISYR